MTGELTDRLARDLDRAFPDFVRAHQDGVYGAVLGMIRHHHDAEEITQETFVRAYRALAGYEPERVRALHSRAWLAQIALNLVRNRARTASRRPVTGPLAVDPAEDGGGTDEVADRLGEADVWRGRLAALPAEQSAALVLRHVWGLSYDELGAATGVPVGTAKARVSRGVEALRRQLAAGAVPMEVK